MPHPPLGRQFDVHQRDPLAPACAHAKWSQALSPTARRAQLAVIGFSYHGARRFQHARAGNAPDVAQCRKANVCLLSAVNRIDAKNSHMPTDGGETWRTASSEVWVLCSTGKACRKPAKQAWIQLPFAPVTGQSLF